MNSVLGLKILLLLFLPASIQPSRTAAPPAAQDSDSNALIVRCEPESPVNGSPVIFRVRSVKPLKSLSGTWQERKVFFDFDLASRTWYGFAGVGIDTASGQHQLALEATLTSGARVPSTHSVTIGRGSYRAIAISVPRKFTEPDAETKARIEQERALKNLVFGRITKDRLWFGRFAAPIESVITERFGTGRTINGVQQSVHYGLDFRADTGSPLGAMNNGNVVIAREMFYEGGFVVIDHGQGLLTLYMHLSEITVNVGDAVKKGQVVGLSGATGRVTAPHLHVGVRWQGIYVDPAMMFKLNID